MKEERKTNYLERQKARNAKKVDKQLDKLIQGFFKRKQSSNFSSNNLVRRLTRGHLPIVIKKGVEQLSEQFPDMDIKSSALEKLQTFALDELQFDPKLLKQFENMNKTEKALRLALQGGDGSLETLKQMKPEEINYGSIQGKILSNMNIDISGPILDVLKGKILDLIGQQKLKPGESLDIDSLGDNLKCLASAKKLLADIIESPSRKNTGDFQKNLESFKASIDVIVPEKHIESLSKKAVEHAEKTVNAELKELRGPSGNTKTFYGITRAELKGLEILEKLSLSGKESLVKSEIEFVNDFMEKSLGNKRLNSALGKVLKKSYKLSAVSERVLNFIRTFSFKGSMHKAAKPGIEKLDNLVSKFGGKEKASNEDKLKLNEYNKVSTFSRLASKRERSVFQRLLKSGVLTEGSKVDEIMKDANHSMELVGKVQARFEKECNDVENEVITSRDMLLEDISLEHEFHKGMKKTPFWHWISKIFVSKFGHAAKINRSEVKGEMKTQLSHVVGAYVKEKLTFDNVAFSRLYRMDVTKLIKPEALSKLKEKYGDKFEKKLNGMYDAIEKKIHLENNKKLQGIDNSEVRLRGAGLSAMTPMGHRGFKKTDYEAVHKRFFSKTEKVKKRSYEKSIKRSFRTGDGMKPNMICSEFVSRATVAALVEFNNQIASELGLKPPENKVINMPFGKVTRLKRIHPELLVKLLKRAGCMSEIPKPPVFDDIFKK